MDEDLVVCEVIDDLLRDFDLSSYQYVFMEKMVLFIISYYKSSLASIGITSPKELEYRVRKFFRGVDSGVVDDGVFIIQRGPARLSVAVSGEVLSDEVDYDLDLFNRIRQLSDSIQRFTVDVEKLLVK